MMMRAYSEMYLNNARMNLGRMLDFAVYDMKYSLEVFYDMFLASPFAESFAHGDCTLLVGKSGVELAYDLVLTVKNETFLIEPNFRTERSPEYWLGWTLAYYQWYTGLSFMEINELISIGEMRNMYAVYHEMDVMHFVDIINAMYQEKNSLTKLKRKRNQAELSQRELSDSSGIPLRTIQQYEQRQKDINRASADTVYRLARVLRCDILEIMERQMRE